MTEQLTLGLADRNRGQANNLAAATAAHRPYKAHAEAALAVLAASGAVFTADDVHRRVPAETKPHHPNVLPSLIGTWAAAGRIERIPGAGVHSCRRSRHSSRNALWRGTPGPSPPSTD